MKLSGLLLLMTIAAMMTACSSSSPYVANWAHPTLSQSAQDEQIASCKEVAATAKQEYVEANSRDGINSAGWVNSDLSDRQKGNSVRDDAYVSCMETAGFSLQD